MTGHPQDPVGRGRRPGAPRRRRGTTTAIGITAAVVVGLVVLVTTQPGWLGGDRRTGNPAEEQVSALVERLAALTPRRVCEAGDAGLGGGNQQPWYDVYLTVDADADLDTTVRAAALESGLTLEIDRTLMEEFRYLQPDGTRDGPDTGYRGIPPGVRFDEASTFLVAERDGTMLQAFIIRRTPVTCLGATGLPPPPQGRAYVRFHLTVPR